MGRERHGIEYAARTCVFVGMAFLIGNGILGGADQILRGTHDANHREKSDGNHKNTLTSASVGDHAVHVGDHAMRQIIGTAAALAAAVGSYLNHAGTENDGLNRLYNCPLTGMCYAIIKSKKLRK